MKLFRFSKLRSLSKQKGETLMEAVVGILLMAVVGMGATYITSRALVTQSDMNERNVIVSEMKSLLLRQGVDAYDLCDPLVTLEISRLPGKPQVQLEDGSCPGGSTSDEMTIEIEGESIILKRPIELSTLNKDDGTQSEKTVVVGGLW